jgi:hypothetical protein
MSANVMNNEHTSSYGKDITVQQFPQVFGHSTISQYALTLVTYNQFKPNLYQDLPIPSINTLLSTGRLTLVTLQ